MKNKSFLIEDSQWPYYKFWLQAVLCAEMIMCVRNHDLFYIYLIIAGLFFGGFLLRVLQCYPGQREPLILDFSAVIIACAYAWLALRLGESNWRFLLIFCSSAIIIPHFVYIAKEK